MTPPDCGNRTSVSAQLLAQLLRFRQAEGLLVFLLSFVPLSASATRIDRCAPAGSQSASGPAPRPDAGHLIIQLGRNDLQGNQIFAEDTPKGRLPSRSGQCVWLPLAPGEHSIRIQGVQAPIPVTIQPHRTTFYRLDDNQAKPSRLLPRFAVWLRGEPGDFPAALRGQLLWLASRADPTLEDFDLADELSEILPQTEAAVQARLAQLTGTCTPKSYNEDPSLEYVLILSRSSPGYRLRVFHTSFGGGQPVAELDETTAAAASCRGQAEPAALQCLLYQALALSKTRPPACLQIAAQPSDARVVLTPLPAPTSAEAAPLQLRLDAKGTLGQPLFVGAQDPQKYRLSVEHPRFLPQERTIDFSEQMVQSVSISLQPRPVAVTTVPLYKKWWLWQSVATAVVVGVTGTVAGIYSGDRGTR